MRAVVTVDGRLVEVGLARGVAELPSGRAVPVAATSVAEGVHEVGVDLGGAHHRARVIPRPDGGAVVHVDGWVFVVGGVRRVEVPSVPPPPRGPAGPLPALVSPLPGLVTAVLVAPGARVVRGEALVVLEAMKMANRLRAPGDGTVAAVHVIAGTAVDGGAVLVSFSPTGG